MEFTCPGCSRAVPLKEGDWIEIRRQAHDHVRQCERVFTALPDSVVWLIASGIATDVLRDAADRVNDEKLID